MKKTNYLLILSVVFMLYGCGGGSSQRRAEDSGNGKKSKGGIVEYNAPAIPQIEPVAEYRTFEGMKPVVTENTKVVVLPDYYTDYQFHDGMLAIQNRQTGKWGFIDTEGNLVIDFLWHGESPRFNHGVVVVGKSNSTGVVQRMHTWYIIDKNGDVVKEFPNTAKVSQFTDGYAYVMQNGMFYYINTLGEQIFDSYRVSYAPMGGLGGFTLRPFSDGLVALYNPSTQRWGYADKQGNDVISAVISDAGDFGEGLAPVKFPATDTEAPKWGFIDKEGNVVIAPVFTNRVSSFSNGYAVATLTNNKQAYIDRTGQIISQEYESARPFVNGMAVIQRERYVEKMEVINTDGYTVTEGLPGSMYAPRVHYYQGKYFTIHHYNTNSLMKKTLYALDGSPHSSLGGGYHDGYDIWNFYGNLAHVKYVFGPTLGKMEYDGFIDFNKGLEYVMVFTQSKL